MKTRLHPVRSAAVVTFATALLIGTFSALGAVNKARNRAVRGAAEYSKDGVKWVPARVGNSYQPGTVIRTGANGTLDLFLAENGPVVRLNPGTELTIEELAVERRDSGAIIQTRLRLGKGRIEARVHKLNAGSVYELTTREAVVIVRGTEFLASADGDVEVISGEVAVKVGNDTKVVPEGMQYSSRTGEMTKCDEGVRLFPPEPEIVCGFPLWFNNSPFASISPFAEVHKRRAF